MKAQHSVSAGPANTILAVVDMQNEFCKRGGACFLQEEAGQMASVTTAIARLTREARAAGVPVLYVQSLRSLQEPQFTAYGEPPMVKEGTWGAEVVEELRPQKGDIVVQAWHKDPFHESRLNHIVEGLAPQPTRFQAIVTGGHICGTLYLTAVGFYLRNFWTVVPVDAAYGDQEGREFALDQFSKSSFPNIFLSRSNLVRFSDAPVEGVLGLSPNT